MTDKQQDKIVQAAAEWWVRLRAPDAGDDVAEQWLAWANEDRRHLETFERVNELAERMGRLDQVSRKALVHAFTSPAPRRRWLPLAAAASVAAMVLGGAVYISWTRVAYRVTTQIYRSGIAQNQDIILPDGTKVALGAASTIVIHYARDRRDVELRGGEVFFDVVHDGDRPFVVNAGDVTVHDIGTAFDVRRTGERVTVAVTQGRVTVADQRVGAGRSNMLEAVAGQRVSFDPAASGMTVDIVAPAQAIAWRNERLEFIGEPLSVVIANVNRYASRPMRIASADLDTLSYTGTIRTDAIDGWVSALPEVFPLRVSKEADRIILSDASRH